MKKISLLLSTLFIACLPLTSFAIGLEKSSPEDQSIYFLGLIFGGVGDVLTGTGNQVLADIFRVFNIAVLTLGSLVVMWTIVVSTISTAQEGEVMGRKWSSMWIPLRSAVGISFLLPTSSGYSLIQILMMSIILKGVDAGNTVFGIVLDNAAEGQSINQGIDVKNAHKSSMGLFESLICMEYLNSDKGAFLTAGDEVTAYKQGDEVRIGIEGNSQYSKICGVMYPAGKPDYVKDIDTWIEYQLDAAEAGVQALSRFAEEAISFDDPDEWESRGVIATGRNAIQGVVSSTPTGLDVSEDFKRILDDARIDGWIFAGAYYHKLIAPQSVVETEVQIGGSSATVTSGKSVNDMSFTAPLSEKPQYKELPADVKLAMELRFSQYLKKTDLGNTGERRSKIGLGSTPELSNAGQEAWSEFTKVFRKIAYKFNDHLTGNHPDPLISMQKVGADIMTTTEAAWFASVIIAFTIMLAGCAVSGMNPLCWALGTMLSLLMPLITFCLALLWSAGVSLGLYQPLIPYILFTFGGLAWLAMVIEAIVAAPVVALGLVSPAQDHLGRASPAVLLITNIFLRPSLMVIGFIAGSRLLIAAVAMINFGFEGTIESSVFGIGLFGSIALIVLYAGIVTVAVHECFSLIHVLPDKVIRWIGGQVEQSSVARAAQQVQAKAESAAKVSGQTMKSTLKWIEEKKEDTKGAPKAPGDMMKDGGSGIA